MIKRSLIVLGIAFLCYILACWFIYFQQPKNFEETVKWRGSR